MECITVSMIIPWICKGCGHRYIAVTKTDQGSPACPKCGESAQIKLKSKLNETTQPSKGTS